MFLIHQSEAAKQSYIKYLNFIGTLSQLFSESSTPYISYRAAENAFCESFEAENLSRGDCSVDASKNGIGVGIKTFLNHSGHSLQKIAEFNKDSHKFRNKTPREIVEIVASLRNERLKVTKRIYDLVDLVYHCVVRKPGCIMVFESPMHEIDVPKIRNVKLSSSNIITFNDGINEYSFNTSKSTLYKRFYTYDILLQSEVTIIGEPYKYIQPIIESAKEDDGIEFEQISREKEYVVLPLFSDRGSRHVPERSGLNQWNSKGRPRNYNEVYIPIPSWIHQVFPGFFPLREMKFDLKIPNGFILNAKVCQENRKALMSNPNFELGQWILRDVMSLDENELLTYERLEELDIDSVIIYKNDDYYEINFCEFGTYDEFFDEFKS